MDQNKLSHVAIRIRTWLNGRNLLTFIILPLLAILFLQPLQDLLSVTLVKYVFSSINSGTRGDIILILYSGFLIIIFSTRFVHYVVSYRITFFLLVLTGFYIYYRNYSSVWVFTPFSFNHYIKYADVIFIGALMNAVLSVKRYFFTTTVKYEENNGFLNDAPISTENKDELGFSVYAKKVTEKILLTKVPSAIAIGVNGKWGAGKTSFIDLIKLHLRQHEEEIITVNFSPWNLHSSNAIIKDFFEIIDEALRPYHSTLSGSLNAYSGKLIDMNDSVLTKNLKLTLTSLNPVDSLDRLNAEVDKAIRSIDKKIVVFIDDLDRLDNEEISEVIRLIRNTANFSNLFFIVAYDRNYILNALKSKNTYNYSHYLEKIFQLEINLPAFDRKIILEKLSMSLKKVFDEKYHLSIDKEIIGSASVKSEYLFHWCKSIRDVNRLVNSLALNMQELIDEVIFAEFLKLELLRQSYPSVYELLYQRQTEIFTRVINGAVQKSIHLEKIGKRDENLGLKEGDYYLELYLLQHMEDLNIDRSGINDVISMLSGIFEKSFRVQTGQHLSICNPSRFNLYFSYSILEGSLSELDFVRARIGPLQQFYKQIDQWIQNDLQFELMQRFVLIDKYDSREDFEKVISAIFYLARSKKGEKQIMYEEQDIAKKLDNYRNKIVLSYYGNGRQKDYETFIERIFKSATLPYSFEAEVLHQVNSQFNKDDFPILEKLNVLVLEYFDDYVNKVGKVDHIAWDLYHCCKRKAFEKQTESTYSSKTVVPPEAKKIMEKLMLKNPDGFLLAMVNVEPFNKVNFSVSEFFPNFYDGLWNPFEKYLDSSEVNSSKYGAEFKKFYEAFKEKDYKNFIPFDFKILPIDKKISEGN